MVRRRAPRARDPLASRSAERPFSVRIGQLYTGAMEKGQMHGKGALVYPNGEKYEGDFQHGKRHGFGVYSYADGGRFEGEWVDDKVHGRGVSVYSSGNR
jgi:hypothetical protein